MQAFGLARIGRDCELRASGSTSVVNIALAFSGRARGEKVTQWVEGALFGKRAESLASYLLKGKLVSVTMNNVRVEDFTKRDGTVVSKMVGDVIEIELCPDGHPAAAAPAPRAAPAPAPAPRPAPATTSYADMDADVPF